MPQDTFAFQGESCHGGKRRKVKVNVLLCAYMDGSEQITALVIGKSALPRYLEGKLEVKCVSTRKTLVGQGMFP